jgi:molybdopterin-synthase adenylyltransferase
MIELRLQYGDVSRIMGEIVGGETERCAVLFASHVVLSDELERLIVTRVEYPEDANYSGRSPVAAELKPDYVARIGKIAARENLSVIFVHSHPGITQPEFSRTDGQGELRLEKFLSVRAPGTKHTTVAVRIVSVGPELQVLFDPNNDKGSAPLKFDRQVRALGAAGQKYLESLTVALVGVGGTGSIAAEHLA